MNNNVDRQYIELLRHIINNGVTKTDRTGTGTLSVFDYTMRFDMSEGFPLLTSKKMFTKGVIHELIWFLKGDTNIKYLLDNDVHIWDGDYNKSGRTDGELGPIYGKQWRRWETVGIDIQNMSEDKKEWSGECWNTEPIDQISNLVNDLKNNPDSRRLMVSAWNVGEIGLMTLPPCHYGFQCYTQEMNTFERKKTWCDSINKNISYAEDLTDAELDTLNIPKRKLSLKWNQRSCDVPLGIPFNIASYGLLLHLLAREVNMIPHELIFSGGDCHIYLNQLDGIKIQLQQETFPLPKLTLNNVSLDSLKYEDIQITGYKSSPSISMPLSN